MYIYIYINIYQHLSGVLFGTTIHNSPLESTVPMGIQKIEKYFEVPPVSKQMLIPTYFQCFVRDHNSQFTFGIHRAHGDTEDRKVF